MTDMVALDYTVRQLHARYVDAVWRKDAEAFAACFTQGAVWKIAGLTLEGRDAIVDAFNALLGRVEGAFMEFGTPLLDLSGAEVVGRTYVVEHRFMGGKKATSVGCYYERFAEEGGSLKFNWRFWSTFHPGIAAEAGPFEPWLPIGPRPAMPDVDVAPPPSSRPVFG